MKVFYDENNNVSLIYYADLPVELQHKKYLEVEELPKVEEKEGFNSILKCDGKKAWYEYEERELTELEVLKKELKVTNQALSELLLTNATMGGGEL